MSESKRERDYEGALANRYEWMANELTADCDDLAQRDAHGVNVAMLGALCFDAAVRMVVHDLREHAAVKRLMELAPQEAYHLLATFIRLLATASDVGMMVVARHADAYNIPREELLRVIGHGDDHTPYADKAERARFYALGAESAAAELHTHTEQQPSE